MEEEYLNQRKDNLSDMGAAFTYQDENKRNPLNLQQDVERVMALTVKQVVEMSSRELEAIFPKYESGEFRPLQHGDIWAKLVELEEELPYDCREYDEKIRLLSGIRFDGMNN